ncbi:pilin [Patescibacteria group bacterium]|nr:pilin [Patescibacteria group bacterium]
MNVIDTINNLVVHKAYASLGSTLNEELVKVQASGATDQTVVQMVINIATPVAVIAVVLLLVYGGFLMMTSKGDPDKLQEAKQVITNAIIGFVVILLCVAILLLISNTLGLYIYD